MRARLAWSLFALTVLAAIGHVILLVASSRPVLSTGVVGEGFPLVTLGAVAGAFVGAVIVSRYPGHPIGWLFVVGQLLSELGLAFGVYGHSALSGQLGSAPGGHLAVWLSVQLGGLLVVAMLAALFLLAPDGRPASPRWRWALALPVLGLAVGLVAVATVDPGDLDRNGRLVGGPGPVLEGALVSASLAVGLGVVAGAVSLVMRLRRSVGDERQQLRWVVVAAVGLALGVVGNIVLAASDAPEWLQSLPVMAAYALVPVFTGVAILRYRLYDIDIFLNRTITLAVLTGFVTVGYVAVVVLIGAALPFTEGTFWASLLATALVALAFQPLRTKVERLADRLVYGARAAPYEELAEFSKRLQESPGADELLRRVGEAVGRAVGARSATIRVDVPGRTPSEVHWPEGSPQGAGVTRTVPVLDGEDRLGLLSVTMPPGAALRPDEERLLEDFAVQLGRAFRNIGLESALVERLTQLRSSTEALEASALRLDLAQDAERQRFEGNLARSVVPHLQLVREGLAELVGSPAPEPEALGRRLDGLAEQTTRALDSLRALTRGVFPTQLARRGLAPALTTHLERTGGGVLEADASVDRRFDPRTESAAYFCVVEFLRALAGPSDVRLSAAHDELEVEVVGPAPLPETAATEHLHDRAEALDGRLAIAEEGGHARLLLRLPLGSAPDEVPDLAEAGRVELGLGDVGSGSAP